MISVTLNKFTVITTDIEKAKKTLTNNGLVAIPTETVYGLAANAFSKSAVEKIFSLKNRPHYNPLIVHIKSSEYLKEIAIDIPVIAQKLAATFWPGPLTLVLKRNAKIPDIVTSGKSTVAVRVPDHKLTLDLLKKLDFPLAAPSANPFGSISPTSAEHVFNYFNDELEVILDGGNCDRGIESTIIGFENNQAILFRHGSLPLEEIEKITGQIVHKIKNDNNPIAPGMLTKHYAPKTTTYFTNKVEDLIKSFNDKKIGVLVFKNKIFSPKIFHQEILSIDGNIKEAASNLYNALHRLDKLNLDLIISEKFPNEDLGKTINDRLERAAK